MKVSGDNNKAPRLLLIGLVCLVVFQAFAYYYRLDPVLGARIIFEPWLMQKGFILYENIADIHSPLLPSILSIVRPLCPDGVVLAKLILVGILSFTTVLVFFSGMRATNPMGGLIAALFFVALSPMFRFTKLWQETLLAPVYLAWMLLYKPDSENRSARVLLYCGLSGGIALLIKQYAIVPFIGLIAWHLCTDFRRHHAIKKAIRDMVIMTAAAALILAMYVLYHYLHAGTLKGIAYWTFLYVLTSKYASLAAEPPMLYELKFVLWCFIFIPFALYAMIIAKRREKPEWLIYGLGFVLFATSSVCEYPRFDMYHLQAASPLIAVLSSMAVMHMLTAVKGKRFIFTGAVLVIASYLIISAGHNYSRVIMSGTPQTIKEYSDLIPLAKDLRHIIGNSDCIFIFPDDETTSNLYYIMQCTPPRFWVFHYPWFLTDTVRQQIQKMLKEAPPKWIVYFPDYWGAESYAPEVAHYIKEHYQQKAVFPWRRGNVLLLKKSAKGFSSSIQQSP